MNKTYKKSDIDKYINEIKEEEINELIDIDGSMIDRNDNYKATPSVIKSKKTTDDFVRGATQGPEAYFIYGGPYYGINYSYVVNEEESSGDTKTTLMDEDISPESLQDLDAFHSTKKKYSRDEFQQISANYSRKAVHSTIIAATGSGKTRIAIIRLLAMNKASSEYKAIVVVPDHQVRRSFEEKIELFNIKNVEVIVINSIVNRKKREKTITTDILI